MCLKRECWANFDTLRFHGKYGRNNDGITFTFSDINTALFDFFSQLILLASFNFGNLNISNTGLYYRQYSTQIVFVYFLIKQNGGRPQLIRPTAICSLEPLSCFTLTNV